MSSGEESDDSCVVSDDVVEEDSASEDELDRCDRELKKKEPPRKRRRVVESEDEEGEQVESEKEVSEEGASEKEEAWRSWTYLDVCRKVKELKGDGWGMKHGGLGALIWRYRLTEEQKDAPTGSYKKYVVKIIKGVLGGRPQRKDNPNEPEDCETGEMFEKLKLARGSYAVAKESNGRDACVGCLCGQNEGSNGGIQRVWPVRDTITGVHFLCGRCCAHTATGTRPGEEPDEEFVDADTLWLFGIEPGRTLREQLVAEREVKAARARMRALGMLGGRDSDDEGAYFGL